MNTLRFNVTTPGVNTIYGYIRIKNPKNKIVYHSVNRTELQLPPASISFNPDGLSCAFTIEFIEGRPDSIGYFTVENKNPQYPSEDFLAAFSVSLGAAFYETILPNVFDYLPDSNKPVIVSKDWKTYYTDNIIPFIPNEVSRASANGYFKIGGLEVNRKVKITVRTLATNCKIYTPQGDQKKPLSNANIIEFEYTGKGDEGKFELTSSSGGEIPSNANNMAISISDTGNYDSIPSNLYDSKFLDQPFTPVIDLSTPWSGLKVESTPFAIVVAHWDDELLWNEPLLDSAKQIVQCGPAHSELRINVAKKAYGESKAVSIIPSVDIDTELARSGSDSRCYRDGTLFNTEVLTSALRSYVEQNDVKALVTHNPWREYGHPNHATTFYACVNVAREKKLDVWFNDVIKMGQNSPVDGSYSYYDRASLNLPVSVDYPRNLQRFNQVKDMYASAKYGDWSAWTWHYAYKDNPNAPIKYFKYISGGNFQATSAVQAKINEIINKVGLFYRC